MKADVDKDGYLRIDASSLVDNLPLETLRQLARYAIFNEELFRGVIETLRDGSCWGDLITDGGPWWFSGETLAKIRNELMPLLPRITAEAVAWFDNDAKQARSERDKLRQASWDLVRAWRDDVIARGIATRMEGSGRGSYVDAFDGPRRTTPEEAEALLRKVEGEITAKPHCARCGAEVGKGAWWQAVPGVGDLCADCKINGDSKPCEPDPRIVAELPPGGVVDVKDPTGCMATETTIDTRCRWHSRAYGGRCELVFGHGGLCVTAGDEFAGGWEPGMP